MALLRPPTGAPARRPPLTQDLAELLAKGFGGLVLLATDFDEPLHAGLELVVVGAGGTAFQVELQLQHLGVAELPIQIAVQLLATVTAIHCLGTSLVPLARTIPDSTAYS